MSIFLQFFFIKIFFSTNHKESSKAFGSLTKKYSNKAQSCHPKAQLINVIPTQSWQLPTAHARLATFSKWQHFHNRLEANNAELANILHTFPHKFYFVLHGACFVSCIRLWLLVFKCSSKSCVEFLFVHMS